MTFDLLTITWSFAFAVGKMLLFSTRNRFVRGTCYTGCAWHLCTHFSLHWSGSTICTNSRNVYTLLYITFSSNLDIVVSREISQ